MWLGGDSIGFTLGGDRAFAVVARDGRLRCRCDSLLSFGKVIDRSGLLEHLLRGCLELCQGMLSLLRVFGYAEFDGGRSVHVPRRLISQGLLRLFDWFDRRTRLGDVVGDCCITALLED